jgi:acyl dehydratase
VTSLEGLLGVELGPTSWIDVPQACIDAFAAATEDHQWIHFPRRCSRAIV